MESTMKHLEIAESKLELGRKLDNQILFRDLMDCIILLKCLMEMVPNCQDYIVRFGELKVEMEKIITVCPDGFVDKVSFFLVHRVYFSGYCIQLREQLKLF